MTPHEEIRGEILKFLKDHSTLVLASSFGGELSAATLYYAADDDFSLYFITKRNSTKYQNLVMEPKAAFVVGTGPLYVSLQGTGTVEPLSEQETEKALEKFRALKTDTSPEHWPLQSMDELKKKSSVLFKIIPRELKFMNMDDPTYPKTLGTEFHKISLR